MNLTITIENTYTFVLYSFITLFITRSFCFELDIGKTDDYAKGTTKVLVENLSELGDYYKHTFTKPLVLKTLYSKDERLYFDPLLTNDQHLVSASVIWSLNNPSVVQLNLEKSTVILFNENNLLSVQAIFSNKSTTNNEKHRHLTSEPSVEVDLSKNEHYQSDSNTVSVTNYELSDPKLKRFNLKYHNLESYILSKLKVGDEELKSVSGSQTVNLEVPDKDHLFGAYVYRYNNFPLLLELVYNVNKRLYYANTPNHKWHNVLFPPLNDPTYMDVLAKRLNYYACTNGFKYTVDVSTKTEGDYTMANYCVNMNRVETVENVLVAKKFTDTFNSGYGYQHKPKDNKLFFVDHLMLGTSVLQFPDVPTHVDNVQAYYVNENLTLLALFNGDKAVSYKLENGVWNRFFTNVRKVNDEYRVLLNVNPIDLLPEKVKITTGWTTEYTIPTIKYDRRRVTKEALESRKIVRISVDVRYHQRVNLDFEGGSDYYILRTREDRPINYISYNDEKVVKFYSSKKMYCYTIHFTNDFLNDTYYIDIYTNYLHVLRFRRKIFETAHWELISIKPMTVVGVPVSVIQKYFKDTENYSFINHYLPDSALTSLPDLIKFQISRNNVHEISTIKNDNNLRKEKKLKEREYDIWWYNWTGYFDHTIYNGELFGSLTVETKPTFGLKWVKYYNHNIMNLSSNNILVHRLEESYDFKTNDMTVLLFTNTLYIYTLRLNYYAGHYKWTLIKKEPANVVDAEDPEKMAKYFELTKNLEHFTLE